MKISSDRILTTHVGSLPRPKALFELIMAREQGGAVDARTFEAESARAVAETVAQQVASGIDIVSDGEMSKLAYTLYVRHRVTGMGMSAEAAEKGRQIMIGRDRLDHPDFADRSVNFGNTPFPACLGPVSYGDRLPLERDLAHLAAAVA
jgi:5-methyltetrahydropteroyltriglutamate--homocysteine methyltransferase